jgi:hypothetical protein
VSSSYRSFGGGGSGAPTVGDGVAMGGTTLPLDGRLAVDGAGGRLKEEEDEAKYNNMNETGDG